VPTAHGPIEIVGRLEGTPPKLAISIDRPKLSELELLRATMGDPSLSSGKRNLLVQQFRVLEALTQKQVEESKLLAAFLEHICVIQREYLLSRDVSAWADAPLGVLANTLGCPLIALPRLLKGRGIAVGGAIVPLDDLVGVERFTSTAKELGYVRSRVLTPTDSMRSRLVVDALLEVFTENRQAILDPVLVVPHPTDDELGYVCEGNHRTASAHLANKKVRIRLLTSKDAIQFHLSGTQAARLAESSTHGAFVSACADQAARWGYQAGSWDMYLSQISAQTATSDAIKILTPRPARSDLESTEGIVDDTTSDALRNAVMELFEGLPGRTLSALDVEERLVLMGVPRSALTKQRRMEFYLRHSIHGVQEVSPGQFGLKA
jgi:hypothetical protein